MRPLDLVLRAVRLLLALWLVVGPFLLGFGWTFPQKQDAVIGLALLPLMAIGLLAPGMRIAMIVAGAWLVASPSLSGWYLFSDPAIWHDRIAGLACLFLGFLPLPAESPAAETTRSTGPAHEYGFRDRLGWSVFRRRREASG